MDMDIVVLSAELRCMQCVIGRCKVYEMCLLVFFVERLPILLQVLSLSFLLDTKSKT